MGDKCTFGTRMPIDIQMLNEMIYREMKHFKNYKIYRPNFGSIPVSGKFYARHDQLREETEKESKKIEKYSHRVSQMRILGPHSKYPAAVTESQVYGWYNKPLVQMDKKDRRFNHHRQDSLHTKIQVIIDMSNPKNRKL